MPGRPRKPCIRADRDAHAPLTRDARRTRRTLLIFPNHRRSPEAPVARPELGTKRVCPTTGRKFYDLNKDPIVSPYSGESWPRTAFEPLMKAPAVVPANDDEEEEAVIDPAAAGAEFVPLEDAEAGAVKDPVADDIEIDEEIVGGDTDDTFLEEEEEGDDDVATLIDGEIEGDEEV
jgi:uncharacterized protein (TIGR02300 family)